MEKQVVAILVIIVLFGLGMLIGGIAWHYTILSDMYRSKLLKNHGIETKALVIETTEYKPQGKKGGINKYWIDYTYTVEDLDYRAKKRVDIPHYVHAKFNKEITVLYLPHRAHISNLPDNFPYRYDLALMIAMDVVLLLSFLSVIWRSR